MGNVVTIEADEATFVLDLARGEPAAARRALEALFDRHGDAVFAFAVHLLGDDALAEDALQETFLRLQRSAARVDPGRPLLPWLYQLARSAAWDVARAEKKAKGVAEGLAGSTRRPAPPGSPVADAAKNEARDRTAAALATLPDDVRALLVQRHGLGMSLDDLAESWSCTERTVRNRLIRAGGLFARALLSPASAATAEDARPTAPLAPTRMGTPSAAAAAEAKRGDA